MSSAQEMKDAVCRIAKKAYNEKLMAGTSGNVTMFDHKRGQMAVTPSNFDYIDMTPDDVVVMNLDGEVLEGEHKPSSEWRMHAEVYRAREDISACVHTHSPRATSFAVVQEKVPVILTEMMPFIGGDIPLAEFALPGTVELGYNTVSALEKRNACLLENHGVVAIGKNLDQAYLRAVYVEDAAKIYHYARALGTPVLLPDDSLSTLRERYNLPE